jgi:hypothetical protein
MHREKVLHKGEKKRSEIAPHFTKPVWDNQDKSCEECDYNHQDIDTFPCAKCHTRN